MVNLKKTIICGWLLLCMACQLDQQLNIQKVGGSPGYFIECYCNPGEMFNLTATRIAPIDEDQYLDYSLEFDIHITTNERFKLYQSLFHQPGTKFIYNYASNRRLDRSLTDSVRLEAIAPDGTVIQAITGIPEDIHIDSVTLSEKELKIQFITSSDRTQNFYILRADFMKGKEMEERDIIFRQGYPDRQVIEHKVPLPEKFAPDSVVIHLKRLTEEGFKYQLSLQDASNSNQDNITIPTPLAGNLSGALGVFTCYTYDRKTIKF